MKIRTLIILLAIVSCKNKKTETSNAENGTFPVLAMIKSQVAHVDTSIYSIVMTVTIDSTSDTSYLKREQFREAAKEFLSIPDIADKKWKDDYTETKQFDPDLNLLVLEYSSKDPEAEIIKEQVYIQPGADGEEDKVERIIIDKMTKQGKDLVRKNLLWKMDSHFQIASTEPGTDKMKVVNVRWTGPEVQRSYDR